MKISRAINGSNIMLTCLLRPIRARNCTRKEKKRICKFFVLSNRSRVSLKLYRFRLSPKSNRHEHESARRPSEIANAMLFVNINYSN